MSSTIKKAVAIARVFTAMMCPNYYMLVSDIAIFLNALFGTYTITGKKVNEMLVATGYQREKNDEEKQRTDLIDIKYLFLNKAKDFAKIDKLIKDGEEIYLLKWKPTILLEIFNINLEDKIFNEPSSVFNLYEAFEVINSICNIAYEYNLINTDKEEINEDILDENLEYFKEYLKNMEGK